MQVAQMGVVHPLAVADVQGVLVMVVVVVVEVVDVVCVRGGSHNRTARKCPYNALD